MNETLVQTNDVASSRLLAGIAETAIMIDPASVRSEPRDIRIQPIANGFLVQVGCQTFTFTNINKLVKNLKAYLSDPNKVEADWNNNKKLL